MIATRVITTPPKRAQYLMIAARTVIVFAAPDSGPGALRQWPVPGHPRRPAYRPSLRSLLHHRWWLHLLEQLLHERALGLGRQLQGQLRLYQGLVRVPGLIVGDGQQTMHVPGVGRVWCLLQCLREGREEAENTTRERYLSNLVQLRSDIESVGTRLRERRFRQNDFDEDLDFDEERLDEGELNELLAELEGLEGDEEE